MSKEIVKKETTSATTVWAKKPNQVSNVDKSDILIPKLLLMQGLSELVGEEKAQMGDIVNSVTAKILGGKEKELSFIPLVHFKDMAKFELIDGEKPKFLEILPWTSQTAALPWEEKQMGKTIKNMARLNFYVLLESEITEATALPYLLSFTSTSYQNGRKLATHFAQADMANLQACSMLFNVTSKKEKNDKGIYYKFDVAPKGPTPEKYISKIEMWTDVLSKGLYQVDNSDFEAGAPADVTPSSTVKPQATAQF